MVKGKDFYGGTVTDAIAEACQGLSTSQDELDIEILETGSSGIFGLCRKKAHIRVNRKESDPKSGSAEEQDGKTAAPQKEDAERSEISADKPAEASRKNNERKKSRNLSDISSAFDYASIVQGD
ncbi:MAG: hypothetical protein D3904_18540, partial [Candidatus Electrothrix sp. EH2]|nr:hypothetical protein [Candidatus Electrothrix sp. EH2]